ncbi:branched-chain amino acid ABC transporter ATP-binding protein/permease [Xanthobacter dioxanivorans]|uniref:Branched-chain amino acid ABC transporter ATP-binding protein/permease n=1 Tax=Xanthobacter dioxanivorans TaxID=2528964 RepID=A0A974PT92_9HYPH|nr:branched-chain amino acid ABC transporter ATP-binding protein/permease [Xanthobacter dioxanivorans]QRG09332.1 branched-chain amino acid ABC transporter ATP-binding protein/permease [Xanthobacter dioxanivorans]
MSRFPRLLTYLLAAIAIVAFPLLAPNPFFVHVGQTFAYTAIAVIGLNILLGLSGQMSLGHGGFYAVGAYVSAILATTFGWPLTLSMATALGASLLAGFLVGAVALRTRGLYLAMATLAFGFIAEIVAQRWVSVTGGTMGLMGVPQIDFGNFRNGPTYFFWFAAGTLLIVQIASDYIFASSVGRRLNAVKESESFAATVGLDVPAWRIGVFAASAALAGLAGTLFAHQSGFVSSDAFNIRLTISLLIATVIGGLGRSAGPLLGTAILIAIAEAIAAVHDIGLMLYGGILLVVLLVFPEGAIGVFGRFGRKPPASAAPRDESAFDPRHNRNRAGGRLEVEAVTKSYAGVVALRDVTLTVEPGTVHALIGPNGAGKSTFINVVAGLYAPTAGRIRIDGTDVTAVSAHRRARLGLVRTFQNLQLIQGVSVLENVMLGMERRRSLAGDILDFLAGARHEAGERAQAASILAFLGIGHLADLSPKDLSYGHRKLVELARAIAQRPAILLLDEPVAGVNPQEAREVARIVHKLREAGVSVLLVEHNMEFVMGLADRVTVLDFGNRIACGTPAAVQKDPNVIRAYLGTEEEAA